MNQYDDVLKCCEEAEKVVKKTREIHKMSEINIYKGAAYFGKKQIPECIKILEEAIKLFEKENNFIGIADTTSQLYSCYYIEKDYKNRLKVLMEYVAVSSKIPEKFEFEFSLRIIILGFRKETFVKRGLVKKLNNSSGSVKMRS